MDRVACAEKGTDGTKDSGRVRPFDIGVIYTPTGVRAPST